MCEHFEILAVTEKMVKGDDDSAIKEYLLLCNHLSDFEDCSILTTTTKALKLP